MKLNAGTVKKKKAFKAVYILKEDRQAFGLIVTKAVTLEEEFSYPITSVPLSIATPKGYLRQSDKASLCNLLISKFEDVSNSCPKNAAWFVDGLVAVRTLKLKKTYKEYIQGILHSLELQADSSPCLIGMINDTYRERTIKDGTRKDRGLSGIKVTL